jgi:hypothetical protein
LCFLCWSFFSAIFFCLVLDLMQSVPADESAQVNSYN